MINPECRTAEQLATATVIRVTNDEHRMLMDCAMVARELLMVLDSVTTTTHLHGADEMQHFTEILDRIQELPLYGAAICEVVSRQAQDVRKLKGH